MANGRTVFVVDADDESRARSVGWLERAGFVVAQFATAEPCLKALDPEQPDVVCMSLELPGIGGLAALREIRDRRCSVPVIVVTGDSPAERVLAAVELGAYEYLTTPMERGRLVEVLTSAADNHRAHLRLARTPPRCVDGDGYREIIGGSEPMRRLFAEMERVAKSDVSVLIHGESGTGKELVARAIRDNGARADGPWVTLNCAAIPETLQESELFGHEKGAFTGAVRRHAGKFERADGGTLFLDEVAELAPTLQAKLLRALQERTVQRIGGSEDIESDFRLIAATNKDLAEEVEAGRFRADLFYRIAVFEIEVPPLRDRVGDVPRLVERFLGRARGDNDRRLEVSDEALRMLEEHSWPGNVRELQNAISRAAVACDEGPIRPLHLPPRLLSARAPGPRHLQLLPDSGSVAPGRTLSEIERAALAGALKRHDGDVTAVVDELGIGRATVYRKLKKYALR